MQSILQAVALGVRLVDPFLIDGLFLCIAILIYTLGIFVWKTLRLRQMPVVFLNRVNSVLLERDGRLTWPLLFLRNLVRLFGRLRFLVNRLRRHNIFICLCLRRLFLQIRNYFLDSFVGSILAVFWTWFWGSRFNHVSVSFFRICVPTRCRAFSFMSVFIVVHLHNIPHVIFFSNLSDGLSDDKAPVLVVVVACEWGTRLVIIEIGWRLKLIQLG